jgi:hypothetical protein
MLRTVQRTYQSKYGYDIPVCLKFLQNLITTILKNLQKEMKLKEKWAKL